MKTQLEPLATNLTEGNWAYDRGFVCLESSSPPFMDLACVIEHGEDGEFEPDKEKREANMICMAASKDLQRALSNVMQWWKMTNRAIGDDQHDEMPADIFDDANNALAKSIRIKP